MLLLTLFLLAFILLPVSAQKCLRPEGGDKLPPFDDDNMNLRIPNGSQAIITSYQFHCCGDITAWQTYVQPGGDNYIGVYSINFQVWRPTSTVGSDGAGEYSLVGENRFPRLTLGSGGLVSENPQPTNVISVRPGDVVGFFQLSDNDEVGNPNEDGGIQLDDNYSNARLLWYQTNVHQNSQSTLVAGTAGTLRRSTNAGPVLSVRISSSSCTPLPTPPPTTPFINSPTDPLTDLTTDPTDPTTPPPTDPPTDPPKDSPIDPSTRPPTDPPADSPTDIPTVTLQLLTTSNLHTLTNESEDGAATDKTVNSNTTSVIVGVVVPTVLLLLIVIVVIIFSLRRTLSKKVTLTAYPATNTVEALDAKENTETDVPLKVIESYNTDVAIKTMDCHGNSTAGFSLNNTEIYYSTVKSSDATDTNVSVSLNECYGTTATEIPLKVNECYSTNMPMKANECYGTATAAINPLNTNIEVNKHHEASSVQMQSNECYGTVPAEEYEYDYI